MSKQEIEIAGPEEELRIRPYEHHAKYYETDQMGIIHHSNYVKWMEEARLDLMDQIGLNYKQMEQMEIISPVLSIEVNYHSMVRFDDTVVIQTKLIKYNGIKRHTPILEGVRAELLLTTNKLHREIVRRQLPVKETKLHPLGVIVKTDNIRLIMKVRTYRQMYFMINTEGLLSGDEREMASQLWKSDMYDILRRMHREPGPFYYRIESSADGEFQSRLSAALDRLSGGKLINSANNYEIVIKLIQTRDGSYFPCLRLCSVKDDRFTYRKNVLSTSIHPSTAALLVELAKPYLKENAQIMDPFCGVGTMLIERKLAVPAREIYATDIYGDAIEMGRENARIAKTGINFIHRDFFDFKHDYKFDELITDMPVRGKQTRSEMELFYERFFDKAKQILAEGGIIVMYSNEIGFVKKQIRLRPEYKLLQETCILDKKGFYLFVIRYMV